MYDKVTEIDVRREWTDGNVEDHTLRMLLRSDAVVCPKYLIVGGKLARLLCCKHTVAGSHIWDFATAIVTCDYTVCSTHRLPLTLTELRVALIIVEDKEGPS